MCPEPQLLSIYLDGELPSPWKEKLESHLAECSMCREKLANFRQLFSKTDALEEQKLMEETKDKIWRKLQLRRQMGTIRRRSRDYSMWQRRISIPIPMAAAAAVVVMFMTAFVMFKGSSSNNNGYAYIPVDAATTERMGFTVAAEKEELPNIIPTADLSDVLQYLGSERSEIIIIQLPENNSFFRVGEPAMIKAADYNTGR